MILFDEIDSFSNKNMHRFKSNDKKEKDESDKQIIDPFDIGIF